MVRESHTRDIVNVKENNFTSEQEEIEYGEL